MSNVEEVVMAMEASCTPESLYSTLGEGDNSSTLLIDKIANESENQEVDIVDRIDLRKVLDTLKPREKQIIVAKMLGISQVQVSRIEKKRSEKK